MKRKGTDGRLGCIMEGSDVREGIAGVEVRVSWEEGGGELAWSERGWSAAALRGKGRGRGEEMEGWKGQKEIEVLQGKKFMFCIQ